MAALHNPGQNQDVNMPQERSQRKKKSTEVLRNSGQSIWLDNITRDLLLSGTLKNYVEQFSITGITSNPSIFDKAIRTSNAYDESIRVGRLNGKSGDDLFFEIALQDITAAADVFRPVYERTDGVDGWASIEISPLLAYNAESTVKAVKDLYARTERPNIFIKIPGTPEGLPAIEESIFSGIPVNVTLLFSAEQYLAAAGAFLSGVERRIVAGLNPNVASVASVFISRWDVVVKNQVSESLANTLGLAVAGRTYKTYLATLNSRRWQRAYNFGARPQRLLWASTGTKDPKQSKLLYVNGLAAPFTVNTMPESTLRALADIDNLGSLCCPNETHAEEIIKQFSGSGIAIDVLARQLQSEGAERFVDSWKDLLRVLDSKANGLMANT
jgi:transaldolase